EATLDVIAARGVRGLTTAAVAERAGISKATMYRRWRSKEALVVDAVASLVSEIAIPDTGSLREDVRALLRDAVRLYADSRPGRLIPTSSPRWRALPPSPTPCVPASSPSDGRRSRR